MVEPVYQSLVGQDRPAPTAKALSVPTNAGVLRAPSTALMNLAPLERLAYNLGEVSTEETYKELLAQLLEG